MNQDKLSICIKMAMLKADLSVADAADKLDKTEATVFNYRAGKVKDIVKLSEFAKLCGMTFEEMMKLAD